MLAFSNLAHTYGRGSLFDHIVTLIGGINVAAEGGLGPYASISGEQVAEWNPDWIVAGISEGQQERTLADILGDPGVAVTTAGRRGQVLLVENRTYLSMSHFAVTLVEQMAESIHGKEELE